MRETAIVAEIREAARIASRNKQLIHGIGDDCAVLRPAPKKDLVFTSDLLLQGRHFTLDTHKSTDVGHKALARSLSDLAAMGSEPLFCLVSLAVPAELGVKWIDGFYRGLFGLASQYGVTLAGGDLARFDHVIADVTCCGSVPSGKSLLRSTARPWDRIYVTGELGGSANGLANGRGKNLRRHLRPEPRVHAGILLRSLGVSACMDISDGLALDLHRLCLESRVGAQLNGSLPIAARASLKEALYGGEDYELLVTAPARICLPGDLDGLSLTEIGRITKGHPGRMLFGDKPLQPKGFEHFV